MKTQNFPSKLKFSVFGHESKVKYPIYVLKKWFEEKHVDLLLTGEEGKRHYVLFNNCNTFIYDITLHHGRTILSLLFTSF